MTSTPMTRSGARWLKPLIALVPLSAGIAFCFLLQLGFVALVPGFMYNMYIIAFRANRVPVSNLPTASFKPRRSQYDSITLVTCLADDKAAGEKAVALFAIENGFSLVNRAQRFSVDAVNGMFVFGQPGRSANLLVFARPQQRLELVYLFPPLDPPATTALTARDKALFEKAGFRPPGSC